MSLKYVSSVFRSVTVYASKNQLIFTTNISGQSATHPALAAEAHTEGVPPGYELVSRCQQTPRAFENIHLPSCPPPGGAGGGTEWTLCPAQPGSNRHTDQRVTQHGAGLIQESCSNPPFCFGNSLFQETKKSKKSRRRGSREQQRCCCIKFEPVFFSRYQKDCFLLFIFCWNIIFAREKNKVTCH